MSKEEKELGDVLQASGHRIAGYDFMPYHTIPYQTIPYQTAGLRISLQSAWRPRLKASQIRFLNTSFTPTHWSTDCAIICMVLHGLVWSTWHDETWLGFYHSICIDLTRGIGLWFRSISRCRLRLTKPRAHWKYDKSNKWQRVTQNCPWYGIAWCGIVLYCISQEQLTLGDTWWRFGIRL